jgi:hypothetical protein
MDWNPERILTDSADSEPTKPSKPGSVGFVGAIPAESPKIRVGFDPAERGISWAEWTAAALNRVFQEQGATGQLGRIATATVRHGERKAGSIGTRGKWG